MARPNGQIIIDADSHVEEADDVWNHLDPAYAHRRPVIVQHPGLPGPYAQDAYWLIDGQMFPRPYGYGPLIYGTPVSSKFAKSKKFSIESQTLVPPSARIADMDKLGIDIQFHSYWEAYSKEFVAEHLDSGDCPAHAAEFETSMALAAFPENAHWAGVDYDAETFDIQSEGYRDRDAPYHYAARDLATPHKGRIMIDAAVEWVAGRMAQMMAGGSE